MEAIRCLLIATVSTLRQKREIRDQLDKLIVASEDYFVDLEKRMPQAASLAQGAFDKKVIDTRSFLDAAIAKDKG